MKKTIIAIALCALAALAALAGCEKEPGPNPGKVEVTSVDLDRSAVVLSPRRDGTAHRHRFPGGCLF